MLYFTKYLPTEGEVTKDGFILIDNKVIDIVESVIELGRDDDSRPSYKTITGLILSPSRVKLLKLFLCSRDIKVGDRYYNVSLNEWNTCVDENMLKQIQYESEHDIERIRVIGEISPDALSYVKRRYGI